MSEIPEDVMEMAREVFVEFDEDDSRASIKLIASAIMAERERCAKVADHWRREAQTVPDFASSETAKHIAADIRRGDRP